jgi:LmbE family N-acetylglucosaminyl deacetylase
VVSEGVEVSEGVVVIEGAGTPEATWQAWPALQAFPSLRLENAPSRVVVVAPHPDDELFGVGGLLRLLTAAGAEIDIVAVTDGEASHPGSPTMTPADLVSRRFAERAAALRRMGLDSARVTRLAIPDGRVASAAVRLASALTELLEPTDWCLATWRGDGHPDHEACGSAAAEACDVVGARLLEYPVWAWHWATPGDSRVPWARASSIRLPAWLAACKQRAAAEHVSQVRPLSADPADAAILPPSGLGRLLRTTETVFS